MSEHRSRRQGIVFKSQRVAKPRGLSGQRRAAARADAHAKAREIADSCPDDPMVVSFLISALGEKHARLTNPLSAAVGLSVQAGRLCPHGLKLVTVQTEAQRVFGGSDA